MELGNGQVTDKKKKKNGENTHRDINKGKPNTKTLKADQRQKEKNKSYNIKNCHTNLRK